MISSSAEAIEQEVGQIKKMRYNRAVVNLASNVKVGIRIYTGAI